MSLAPVKLPADRKLACVSIDIHPRASSVYLHLGALLEDLGKVLIEHVTFHRLAAQQSKMASLTSKNEVPVGFCPFLSSALQPPFLVV